ncbi:MAG: hypothetical protein WC466_06210 [Candidatus Izemoplasmatales bacterium]
MKESMNLKDLKSSNTLVAIYIDDLSNLVTLEETFYSVSKQTYKVDLLVLYPNSFNDEQVNALKASLENSKIILRKKDEEGKMVEEAINAEEKINYFLLPTSCKNFPELFNESFNVAIKNDYEFISIIEPNDIIGFNWYKQASDYAKENGDISMFFPIIRNTVNGAFSGFLNEAPWAEGLSEEAGKIDLNLLQRFNCMVPIGATFSVKNLSEYSETKDGDYFYPFKESIKISHYYEFLMRMVYNDIKGMVIPRVGYEFKIKTTNIFNETCCKIPQNITQIPLENGGVTQEEGKFWMDLAKKEYFFDEDRNKVYESEKK